MPRVSILKVSGNNIHAAVSRVVDSIGLNGIRPDSRVVIKPNLCGVSSPARGAVVDPRIIESLIRILRERFPACSITIVESDSQSRTADEAFRRLGYVDLADKYNVDLVNLTHDKKLRIELPNGAFFRTFNVPMTLLLCDYFISVGKLKTHHAERISCILKNQLGCHPSRYKMILHSSMSKVLADLNSMFRPNLSIIDGLVAMEGLGPTDGSPKKMNLIMCSDDPVAIDTVAARIMGFNPKRIGQIKSALRSKVGTMRNITMLGEPLDLIRTKFVFSRRTYLLYRLGFMFQRTGNSMYSLGKSLQFIAIALYAFGFRTARKFSLGEILRMTRIST